VNAGGSATVTFPTWLAAPLGSFATKCSTELGGDVNPENNLRTGSVNVVARDVGVSRIIAPTGTVDSGTLVVPSAWVRNYGGLSEYFSVYFRIGSSYADTQDVDLNVGESTQVMFDTWPALTAGTYATKCSTMLQTDTRRANDWRIDSVIVLPRMGLLSSEGNVGLASQFRLRGFRPNPLTERALISYSLGTSCYNWIGIYDVHGALVRRLVEAMEGPGKYEVAWNRRDDRGRRLAAGVYFCRMLAGEFKAISKLQLAK
jgi:hypothetical protein